MSKKHPARLPAKKASLLRAARPTSASDAPYYAFENIDGRHPWQTSVPEGFVPYPVRRLDRGKVVYFNFPLAKEMGLLPAGHPHELNDKLAQKILETFAIQIVNEYDQINGSLPPKDRLKPHAHMATRYLQLQHTNKKGKTSGDGRSIWNGIQRHRGVTWDVSSRGTGVTCLAPGSVQANQPLRTGDEAYGYGCGLADVAELWGSAVMSEIFHLNGVPTERVLTVIDLGKGCGIGVRAAPNLIRPAHLFLYLKQGRFESLRRAADYLIQRQIDNGIWKFSPEATDRYAKMLNEVSCSFAKFGARLEREYIFAWMDWDGDNVLADAGIIDYGSIRQFGLRHDQYKYDDVERFSTNLNEQRGKARLTVQVFAQLVDYLETGKRRVLEDFSRHEAVRTFDREFDRELRRIFLWQVGLDERQIDEFMEKNASAVERLFGAFLVLEKTKTRQGPRRVPDGVNRPAVFNMRAALRELPDLLMRDPKAKPNTEVVPREELLDLITSSFARKADLRLRGSLSEKLSAFQKAYVTLVHLVCAPSSRSASLRSLSNRARERNRSGRITGNASEFVVDAVSRARRRGVSVESIQRAIELFIASQAPKDALPAQMPKATSVTSDAGKLFQEMVNICLDFEEDI